MKFISFIITVLLFVSCHSSKVKQKMGLIKRDTVSVIGRRQQDGIIFADSAIREVYRVKGFKDTSTLDGFITEVTTYRLMQIDSAKRVYYQQQPVDTSLNKYIITTDDKVPHWPKN